MVHRLLVATRKGLFILQRTRGNWHVEQIHFLGDPVTQVLVDARDGQYYAALNLGHFGVKLNRSGDEGHTWQPCLCPAFPAKPKDDADPTPWSVMQLWTLEAGGTDQPGVLWAGTIPGALFRSDDHGESWVWQRSLWDLPERREWMGGGYDHPGLHSICVDPQNSQRLSVAVSTGGVWHSDDGGARWRCTGPGIRAEYLPPERQYEPHLQDPHRLVQCRERPECLWMQHHNGIFRSVDYGKEWREITTAVPSAFGFAVLVHPRDPELAWFAPAVKDECRVPVDGALVVSRTRDGGGHFETLRQGLPQRDAYDLIYRHAMDLDAEGNTLAMGSTTGSLWLSEDQGESWQCLHQHLPPIYQVRFVPG